MKKIKLLLTAVCLCLTFISCETTFSLKANLDNSVELDISADVGKLIYDTVISFAEGDAKMKGETLSEAAKNGPVFDQKEIVKTLKQSDLSAVQASVPSNTSVKVAGTLDSSKAPVVSEKSLLVSDFVKSDFNDKCLSIVFTPDSLFAISEKLPEDAKSFIELLMAPVFTGEKMTAEDYMDLIAVVYGEELKAELEKSSIKIVMKTPDGCTLTKGTSTLTKAISKSKDSYVFSVPVAEFLTLDKSCSCEIFW